MGLFDHFPYTNFHELNLDWILQALKELEHTIEQFVSINALKYADPIQWNITSQYEKNTIVIDPQTGTAYISVDPVPAGVALTNTDYWTVVFDLGSFIVRAAQNFTDKWEQETTTTASFASSAGDWLVIGDVLYEALANINPGDSYILNSNIKHITMEDITGHLQDLITTDKSSLVNAINEEVNERTTADTEINNILSSIIPLSNNGLSGFQVDDAFSYQLAYVNLTGSSTYAGLQGAVYNPNRNSFVIGFLEIGNETNGMLVEVSEDLSTVIQRVAYPNNEIRHCNDITYNPNTDKYYIAGYQSGSTNMSIIEVNPANLAVIQEIPLLPAAATPDEALAKICYDSDNDVYYGMSNRDIFKYSNDFTLLSVTPFVYGGFLTHYPGSLVADPLQSIEYKNEKLYSIYTLQANTSNTLGGVVVVYNLDGSMFTSYPLNIPLITLETESIMNYKGNFKIFAGTGFGLFSTTFALQTRPTSNIGVNPMQSGIDVTGTDLDTLKLCGIYYVADGSTTPNSPFPGSNQDFNLYCIAGGAGIIQIAVMTAGSNFIAIRRCNYLGVFNNWEYSPKCIIRGKTYDITGNYNGYLVASGNAAVLHIPVGSIGYGITTSNLSVNASGMYLSSVNGLASHNAITVQSITIVGEYLSLSIVNNDSSPFGTGGNPINAVFYGSLTVS